MFHFMKRHPRQFLSNPPLPNRPVVVALQDKSGNVYNDIEYVPQSNRSDHEGTHFTAETMSLRAKLNLGIHLTPVSFGVTENDPTVLMNSARRMNAAVEEQLATFNQQSE